MKTKNLTIASILLALGTMMHFIIPGILGMKPDFLLLMMFIAILFNMDFKSVIAIGSAAGILAAITTNFPGGQIPSILDKVISAIFVYTFAKAYLKNNNMNNLFTFILGFTGTIVSGIIFIYVASVLVGLPAGLNVKELVLAVVLPTSVATGVLNTFLINMILIKNKNKTKIAK